MRPHMSHLDVPTAKSAAPVVKAEAANDELSLLSVTANKIHIHCDACSQTCNPPVNSIVPTEHLASFI